MIDDYFKPFCRKNGNFFYPNRDMANDHMYNEILKVFKNNYSFNSISVVCTPYCKIKFDKSTGNDAVANISYVLSDADKSMPVYLNGEVSDKKANRGKIDRKIKCCFKVVGIKPDKFDALLDE